MKKKLWLVLLALVSALCLCFGLAACGEKPAKPTKPSEGSETKHTFTADNVCSDCGEKWAYTDGLEYELDGDAYTVTGIGTASGDIVIPYGHEGKFVTKIADEAFKGSEAITGIYIPEKIVSVGRVAFAECPNLISATWDAADCAKAGVTMDEAMNLPPEANPEDYMVFANTGLKALTIGGHVKSIPVLVFAYCSEIKTVVIPDGVTSIGAGAFSNCELLESVTIGKGVTFIDQTPFAACNNLTNIQWNAENCATIDFEQYEHAYVFELCYNLKTVVFGDSVKTIPASLFYECDSLESVTIGKNVTKIGEDAFYSCGGINAVHITDLAAWCRIEFANEDASPTGYGDCLLYLGEEEIKELIIPSEITEIKNYAFMNFYELTSVVIPDSVTSIGEDAFDGCSGLTSIAIPDSVTSIGDGAFRWCDGLESITVDEGNPNYSSQDGILYDKKKTEIVHVPKAIKGNLTIPVGVTSLGRGVFSNHKELTGIEIPDGVTSIDEHTFAGCTKLKNVTIPDSMNSIGEFAFADCSALTSIEIPNGVLSIGAGAFSNCSGLSSVAIPDGVTSIEHDTFYGCSELTNVTIPASVTSIEEFAFYNCSSLTNIQFEGTVENWQAIQIEQSGHSWQPTWNMNTGDYTITCTDGKIAKNGTVTMN